MSKFVRITGAGQQETAWFSRTCNALGGQIGHILQAFPGKVVTGFPVRERDKAKDAQTAAIYFRQRSQPYSDVLFALFLAYSRGLKRVFDPVYEFMT